MKVGSEVEGDGDAIEIAVDDGMAWHRLSNNWTPAAVSMAKEGKAVVRSGLLLAVIGQDRRAKRGHSLWAGVPCRKAGPRDKHIANSW